MPNRVKDPYSGAILFVPTDEEKEIATLKERLSKGEKETANLKERLSKLEKAQKAGLPVGEQENTKGAGEKA